MNTIQIRNTQAKALGEYLYDVYKATLDSLNTSQEFRPLAMSDYTPSLIVTQPLIFRSMAISIKMVNGKVIQAYGLIDFVNQLIQEVLDGNRVKESEEEAKKCFIASVPFISAYNFEFTFVEVGVVDNTPVMEIVEGENPNGVQIKKKRNKR